MKPDVQAFFDKQTFTVTYVLMDPSSRACAIIDPVLDFDPAASRTSTGSVEEVLQFVEDKGLEVTWILETHAHADHLSAAAYLKAKTGGKTATGKWFTEVQSTFKEIFNLGDDFLANGEQFDRLLDDGDLLELGAMSIRVIHTPGHTPACVTYVADDAAFVGDTLFMPDYGTARADFPGADAGTLYRSIQRIFELPASTRIFLCHDYKAPGRDEFAWETTVAEQMEQNIHVHKGVTEQEFVEFRNHRDAGLGMPKLILPSIQVNIRAGEMPPADDNGTVYLRLPLNVF
ncbi:MAG: MBL fold metallo-hydrolase [Gammaproteobacteria bacterium]|nr:MBL fold metallo-hydrolase [Gammaproteobacteria bacterium]NNK98442.1 MBL fold metallo-hydrolase [Xanthomonadales bacterium]